MFNRKSLAVLMAVLAFVLLPLATMAQKIESIPTVSAVFKQAPLQTIVTELEKQSSYRFYFDPVQFDSLKFDLDVTNLPLDKALEKLFSKTELRFAIDADRNVFITKDVQVKTSLPEDFFTGKLKRVDTSSITQFSGRQKKVEPSTLENRLYTIGAANARNKQTTVTVTGYIYNSKTGEPVGGAAIFVENTKNTVLTDQYGYYTLSLNKGRHLLSIKSIGMRQTKRQLAVNDDGELDIVLQEEVMTLTNVTVKADKANQVRNMQMGIQRLDAKTIKQVPVVFGEADVLRVALTLPGVKSVGEASTGLNVRGGSADQNLILFNDATIYNPSHFFGMFSTFNAETVKDIQLYKSGIPVKYGGRLSSVLEVNGREGNKKQFTGSAGIGLVTTRFNLEGPITKDKTSFIVGARTTYANWLLKYLPDQYKNSEANFYDLNLGITHEINKKNSLYLMGYMSNDKFNLNSDTTYQYGNRNFSVKWKHVFNNHWNGVLTTGYDNYRYKINSEAIGNKAYKLDFDINQTYLRAHANYYANAQHSMEIGFSTLFYKLHPGSLQPQGSLSAVTPKTMEAEQALESALYISDNYKISPEFNIEGGIRYSIFNYLGPKTVNEYAPGVPLSDASRTGTHVYNAGSFIRTYHGPEFRITGRYMFTNDFSVKAGFNTQKQYIHMLSNTASMSPTDIWKLSDPNIKPQNGYQASVGFYKNYKNSTIETSLEFYYKSMKGFLDYKSGAVLVMNDHIETDVMSTKGHAYGVELLVKKSVGKLNGWISYTFSRTFLQMSDSSQGPLINNGNWYPANYDKPQDVTVAGNYHATHRFGFSWNFTYSTGRPITLPIGRFDYSGGGRTMYADRNAYRIPDYLRVDLSMTLDGNHKTLQRFHNSFTIGAYNLTGRQNPYSVYYISEGSAINGYKLSIFGTIIPYITYNIKF
jgi:hypothetical protein